jgi:ribosomal protein S18 acetylase RimI-like enzyme
MTDDVHISAMALADYDEAVALWGRTAGLGRCDSHEKLAAFFERNPGCSAVARQGGELVGVLLAGHDGRNGYLHRLAVGESFRRRGVARRLVQFCTEALGRQGITHFHICVLPDNEPALAFWRAMEWESACDALTFHKDL